jgi:uncharacterized protein (DUF2252 family)
MTKTKTKTKIKAKTKTNPKQTQKAAHFPSLEERRAYGKSLRDVIHRKDQSLWVPSAKRRDPIAILEEQNLGRIPELLEIRHGRMMKSPFTFFRGSAAVMAADLATTAVTKQRVQLCGDCHLLNFGGFATPERNVIVDINDFDETLPGPWEWDLKRLATSFVLACRGNSFKPSVAEEAAEAVARSYRTAMREFSEMTVLDIWYSKLTLDSAIAMIKDDEDRESARARTQRQIEKSKIESLFPKLTAEQNGRLVFKDDPPLIYHSSEQREVAFLDTVKQVFKNYRATLSESHQVLIDRFELMDIAMKVVGIGSVGTYCGILLLMAGENDPLILQVKQACPSVLEPYVGKGKYDNNGHRVVAGQRLMQAQSDMFLGWAKGLRGRDCYVRQLRDMKISPIPELWTPAIAIEFAKAVGWVLARAHARSGDSAVLSGYMGSRDIFDKAIAQFAIAYADQAEADHKALLKAIRSGRLEAYVER